MNQSEPNSQPTSASSARRNEDIALDLLRFVAGSTNILRTAAPSTGFTAASAPKPEDQVTLLLDLYSRCLSTIAGNGDSR